MIKFNKSTLVSALEAIQNQLFFRNEVLNNLQLLLIIIRITCCYLIYCYYHIFMECKIMDIGMGQSMKMFSTFRYSSILM